MNKLTIETEIGFSYVPKPLQVFLSHMPWNDKTSKKDEFTKEGKTEFFKKCLADESCEFKESDNHTWMFTFETEEDYTMFCLKYSK